MQPSIAILPFKNTSNDPGKDYFAEGIAEEIINALTRLGGLKVTARTSSFAFKGQALDAKTIGQRLNVMALLEGSAQWAGDKVRISAQLVNTADGFQLWSERWDRSVADVFAVQDEVSLAIAEKVRENLGHFLIEEHLVQPPTHNLAAYDDYLKGLYALNKWTPEEIQKALQWFASAIEKDEKFAMAYARLSLAYMMMGALGAVPVKDSYPQAKSYALQSIQLDDQLALSHATLGLVQTFTDWDFKGAQLSFQTALDLQPGDAGVHHGYAMLLLATGYVKQAVKEMELAAQLDPFNPPLLYNLGTAYLDDHEYDKAIAVYQGVLQYLPDFRAATEGIAWALAFKGEYDKALETYQIYREQIGDPSKSLGGLSYFYSRAGKHDEAQQCLDQLQAQQAANPAIPLTPDLTVYYLGIKDHDKVLACIDQLILERYPIIWLRSYPVWDEMKHLPAYQAKLQKMGGIDLAPATEQEKRYARSGLDQDQAVGIRERLDQYMVEKHPYLENDLSLKDLSQAIDVPGNTLSQVLNEVIGKNFYEYVNAYRLEAFKEQILLPENEGFTLLAIAFQCGFNSKTNFNTYFKKAMGQTPSQYLKSVSS